MKKAICILLSITMCLSLFGCTIAKPVEPVKPAELKDNTARVLFFKTDEDADSALITYGDLHILVDTGEKGDGSTIVNYLKDNDISTLDYIIFSHFDKDHCGGAQKILDKITCKEIIHGKYIKDSVETQRLFDRVKTQNIKDTTISEKQVMELNGLKLTILPAEKDTYAEKESNNSSMVVKLEVNEHSVLFTGDCQEERVSELLNSNEDLSADVLKLMYHGREVANEEELIDRIKPSCTIITTENDKKKVTENIDKFGTKLGSIYYTCEQNVCFDITSESISVTPYN